MTDFIHRFEQGAADAAPLLLLHGTGGDENDLVPLATALAPERSIISVRGKVLENGMPRFFRRLGEGVFDMADLAARAAELAEFVTAVKDRYGLEIRPLALGYSNGANIAAALLFMHPSVLGGAALLRAQLVPEVPGPVDLAGIPVLLVSGVMDPIVPAGESRRLAAALSKAGAAVSHETLQAGHGLTQSDIKASKAWLAATAGSGGLASGAGPSRPAVHRRQS